MGTVCTLGAYGRWTKLLLFILLNSENQIDTWIHSTLISRIPNPYYTEQFAITNYLFYEMANFHSRKLCQHKLIKQMFDCSAVKYIDSQRIESVSIVFKHQMISDLIKNILSLKIWNDKNWNLQLLKDLCTEREAISRKQPLIHLHFYLEGIHVSYLNDCYWSDLHFTYNIFVLCCYCNTLCNVEQEP